MVARILTIAPGRPFLDALAAGLLDETAGSAEALADYIILLPTRRACRALAEAFLRVGGGKPLILPAIRPLGDVDEDGLALDGGVAAEDFDLPPAIPGLRRQLLLTRMIIEWKHWDGGMTPDQAARLAAELARLVDQVQTERLDFAGLAGLAPAEHAGHWQDILAFLSIVTENWPAILAAEDCLDPADRRNRLLASLAKSWRDAPPKQQVIAAGSTGSIPATADLLETVAGLARGRLVLPGLDRNMDAASRTAALHEPTHPQHGMLRLLARLGTTPDDVRDWPGASDTPASAARTDLVAEALRPAATTDSWRDLKADPVAALAGVERIDCANEAEEAGVIALMLRAALETPERTAALVTPDRQLARRVAAELGRWGIAIDDSAGQPLADTPPGGFLRLVVAMAAMRMAPLAMLSALKHPLAAGGLAPGDFRAAVRQLEKAVLRGPRPAPGFDGLRAALTEMDGDTDAIRSLIGDLEARLVPLTAALEGAALPLQSVIDAHVAAAEALAESDTETGSDRLWVGEAGEALAGFTDEMRQASEILPDLTGRDYPALFDALIAGRVVRPRYGRHPRLNIWGPLEARLQHADLMILGGLNEGSWPPQPAADPWMSRPMREKFGLAPAERRIGLAAHDFTQAFAAPKVALVRATRQEGAPSVPSRWLIRLETVLGSADALSPSKPWPALYHALSRPEALIRIDPPAPTPPVAARPRSLSVTRIEMWMRDPYAIYASQILRLAALDPVEADPGVAERGTFIHKALDDFVRENPGVLPADALARLVAYGERAFGAALARPAVRAFWWPRFLRIAAWFLDAEQERRAATVASSATEVSGRYDLKAPAGVFTLTATADRIDRLKAGGSAIIDYKTGSTPSEKMVRYGFSPQLPLEAVILAAGGFEGVPEDEVAALAYWRLTGGEPPGEIRAVKSEIGELAYQAHQGLAALVAAFDNPATPYHATPRPAWAPVYNDYLHLARTAEWSAAARGDGD